MITQCGYEPPDIIFTELPAECDYRIVIGPLVDTELPGRQFEIQGWGGKWRLCEGGNEVRELTVEECQRLERFFVDRTKIVCHRDWLGNLPFGV